MPIQRWPIGNGAGGITGVVPADGIAVTKGLALRVTGGSLYDGDTTPV